MENTTPSPLKTADIPRTLAPLTGVEKALYSPMLQGTGTNKLTQISTRKTAPDIDAITGLATITYGNLTVFIEKYATLEGEFRISTHKLLDACTIALTAQANYRDTNEPKTLVSIPLEDYMEQCGTPLTKASKDKTRRKVKKDLEAIYSTSLEWSEPKGKQQVLDFAKMRICDMVGIKTGNIVMNFSPLMAHYLTHAYIMQYPMELFKLGDKNPNSYYLGKKLLQHHSIDNNQLKGTANIISVKALLECTPEMPSYEAVKSKDRHLTQRIIDPFQRDMDALSSIFTWEYCNSKGVPLTDEQLQGFNYKVFIACYIHFTPLNAPDQSARLQAKTERVKRIRRKASKKKNYNTADLFEGGY